MLEFLKGYAIMALGLISMVAVVFGLATLIDSSIIWVSIIGWVLAVAVVLGCILFLGMVALDAIQSRS